MAFDSSQAWRSLWTQGRSSAQRRFLSNRISKRERRRFRRALLEQLEPRHLLAAVNWDGGGDGTRWDDPVNWSSDALPTAADDVTIDAGYGTIEHNAGDDSVHSLTTAAPFILNGGILTIADTLQVNNNFTLSGGALSDATVNFAAGQTLVMAADGGNRLTGVTVNGDLDLATNNGATVHVVNGLTLNGTAWLGNATGTTYGGMYFDGTQTLGGTGDVVFGKNSTNFLSTYDTTPVDADTLTIGPDITVRGSSGTLGNGYYYGATIVNEGTILADDSGGASSFAYDAGFSYGYTSSTAESIDTSGVTDPAPQVVYQTARDWYNLSNTLPNLTAGASYTVRLHFAELQGYGVGERLFHVSLNGTQVLTDFDIVAEAGGVNRAVVREFTAVADASGDIVVNFDSGNNWPLINGIELLSGATVVQAINAGLLPGGTFTINPSSFTNVGQITVSPDETLSLQNTWTNAVGGTIAAAGATLNLGDQYSSSQNAWSNAGSINATDSTVNLGGQFTVADLGTLNRTGGTVNLVGTLENSGATLTLDATTGSWNLTGGVIHEGTYTASGGAGLNFTSSGGTLDNVTANGDLDLATNSYTSVTVVNGLTLNGTAWLGNATGTSYGYLYFQGTQTLGGTGEVVFGKSSSNFLSTYDTTFEDSDTLTIDPGITVRGSSGRLGDSYNGATIVNQGTILADDSGGASRFDYDRNTTSYYYNVRNTSAAIDVSGVSDPAPQVVYQTAREDYDFTYTLTDLTAGADYTLRLHFAELADLAAGQRLFHVEVNGTQVLTDFDIVGAAGAINKAAVQELIGTAGASGNLVIRFIYDGNSSYYPLVNGLELLSGATAVQAINVGQLPGGTLTINSTSFVNEGQIDVSNGETLDVSDQYPGSTRVWHNTGTIIVTEAVINLGGLFTLADVGILGASNGVTNLTGTLDNRTFDRVLVNANSPAKAFVPTDEFLEQEWLLPSFDDSTWQSGRAAVGYDVRIDDNQYASQIGLNVESTMHNQNASVYVRMPFSVADPQTLGGIVLRMKYDDGFVAYLNGVEIARRNAYSLPAEVLQSFRSSPIEPLHG
jgi:hypothetical protein